MINPIVEQIINRDCHVSWTNRRVIKHVISRLKHKRKTWLGLPNNVRKDLMRDCITVHKLNGELFHMVMTGKF